MSGIIDSVETNWNAERVTGHEKRPNLSTPERVASVVGGGALALYGASQKSLSGAALALLGGVLVHRGATGHCELYHALGISTADEDYDRNVSVEYGRGIRVDQAVTISRSPEEVYQFWRRLENLPRFMDHLESVTELDEKRSHWVAKGPAGKHVEWDAEIINEIPNELIGWRSLEGAEVDNAGSVQFNRAPGGRGTELRVELRYDPPGGPVGALFARLFGEEPNQQIGDDLRNLKAILEAGERPTTEGQPSGRLEA
jgi:uncharacterized membrane protein